MNMHVESSAEKSIQDNLIREMPARRRFWEPFLRWEWMMVLLLLVVVVFNSRVSPYFLDIKNLARSSFDFMELGIMMLPLLFIIITGNIDLSIASTMGMSASLMGLLHNMQVNIWVAVLCGLMIGGAGGLLNGYLVAKVKLPALVVTIGTYAFFRGLAYSFLGDQAAKGYPDAFTYIGQGYIPGSLIPMPVVIFLTLAIIFGLVLHKSVFGRRVYAIGNNEKAASYSGVPADRIKILLFVLSGLISALAGIVLAARFGSTRPDIGTGFELTVITIAVLGGIDINGGVGTMIGACLALVTMGMLKFGMGLVDIKPQEQIIVIGLILILSILIPTMSREIRDKNIRMDGPFPKYTILVLLLLAPFIAFFLWTSVYGIGNLPVNK
jgi:rhamnose transport system permease protein